MAKLAHSHSRVATYTSCPLAFKLQYIDKVGTEDSDALQIGAAAHDFFDMWLHVVKETLPGEREALKKNEALIVNVAAKAFQKEPRDQKLFKEVLDIAQGFTRNFTLEPGWTSIESEVPLAFDRNWQSCDWMSPNVYFRAKLDVLMKQDIKGLKHARVIDYKTGYGGQVNDFQLELYALAVTMDDPKIESVEVVFHYIKSGHMARKMLSKNDLGTVRVQLESLTHKIEGDSKFKAKPGARCLNCSVAAFCDKKPDTLVPLKTLKDAEKLAADLAMLEAQEKAKKKMLKTWVEVHGPVNAEGLTYGLWPRDAYDIDVVAFMKLAAAHGLKLPDFLKADTTAIKKLCKKTPELAEPIANITTVETTQSFYAKKEEGD